MAKQQVTTLYIWSPQGVKYPNLGKKLPQISGIMQITSQFDFMVIQNSHKNTFSTEHDSISSK
jgi:hypothetical protein